MTRGDGVRVAIVGGGIAGVLLAWRLCRAAPGTAVTLFTGGQNTGGTGGTGGDATAASGGLVRGFETDAAACRMAAGSLAELRGDAILRAWADYREVGSVYLLPPGTNPAASVRVVGAALPGSVTVISAAELAARYPFRGLPEGTTAVVERHAGYLSPARLRSSVLSVLAGAAPGARIRGCVVHDRRVAGVTPAPAVRLVDGPIVPFDIVVVAAGAWTPRLLAASGLPTGGLRTKQIQYAVHALPLPALAALRGLGAFVEGGTGFYGRPTGDGAYLLGLPSQRWDVDPAAVTVDPVLAGRVVLHARRRLGVLPWTPAGVPAARPRAVASFDCYADPPGLVLRDVVPGAALFTFTGGSGGAAKAVLAASRAAAGVLAGLHAGYATAPTTGPTTGPATGPTTGPARGLTTVPTPGPTSGPTTGRPGG